MRHAFNKYGGNLGTDGSVSYLFVRKGVVVIDSVQLDDDLIERALDLGVDDVSVGDEDNTVQLVMASNLLSEVVDALKSFDYEITQADHLWVAEMHQNLDQASYEKFETLYDALLELDDVQSVFTNAAPSV